MYKSVASKLSVVAGVMSAADLINHQANHLNIALLSCFEQGRGQCGSVVAPGLVAVGHVSTGFLPAAMYHDVLPQVVVWPVSAPPSMNKQATSKCPRRDAGCNGMKWAGAIPQSSVTMSLSTPA